MMLHCTRDFLHLCSMPIRAYSTVLSANAHVHTTRMPQSTPGPSFSLAFVHLHSAVWCNVGVCRYTQTLVTMMQQCCAHAQLFGVLDRYTQKGFQVSLVGLMIQAHNWNDSAVVL